MALHDGPWINKFCEAACVYTLRCCLTGSPQIIARVNIRASVNECIYATARDSVCLCVRVNARVLLCAVKCIDCHSAVDVRVVETLFHKTYYLTL